MRLAERVGRHLRALRLERGLSQARLAELAGLTTEAVSRFERGAKEPRLSSLERLAAALQVDPGFLFRSFEPGPVAAAPNQKGSSQDLGLEHAVRRAVVILERAAKRAARQTSTHPPKSRR